MANTTNLDLVKPASTDHALISVLNSNSDKIDAFAGQTKDDIETLEEGLAYIVGNTNTTGETLAVGQFVYVKGHSTIPNGLRKVTASISNNASITTSNTSPDTAGGLNTLNSNLTALQNSVPNKYISEIVGNSSTSFTISNYSRIVLFAFGNSTSRMSIWNIYTSSSGSVTIGEMVNGGSMLSITSTGNNSITMTNSGSAIIYTMFLVFNGSITVNA